MNTVNQIVPRLMRIHRVFNNSWPIVGDRIEKRDQGACPTHASAIDFHTPWKVFRVGPTEN